MKPFGAPTGRPANVVVLPERPGDAPIIEGVVRVAFESAPYRSGTEHLIVKALREAKALAISLVAVRSGQVVGYIAFSRVSISDGSKGWYGLGPVAVLPEHRSIGIGRLLIEDGIALLEKQGAEGCVVLGDPKYYSPFAFDRRPGLVLPGVPEEFFLAISFSRDFPQGEVAYHPAFSAKG